MTGSAISEIPHAEKTQPVACFCLQRKRKGEDDGSLVFLPSQACHVQTIDHVRIVAKHKVFLMRAATVKLVLSLAVLFGAVRADADAPVPVVNGYVTTGFEGWTKLTEGLPADVSYVHRPNVRSQAGAFLWFQSMPQRAAPAAFLAALKSHNIEGARILASHPVKGAKFLDSQGSGATLVAEGVRNGRPVKVAAFVFYGSTNGTERVSGVHGFAAPTALYESMGGWLVPAALWMNLDPQREVGNVPAQGKAPPAVQVARFANIANLWSEWALNTMKGLAQGNVAAMSSARQTMICAGDPACRLVPVQ
jgi:hypothetical protein